MYMRMYVYTCIHTYIQTDRHTYILTYINTHTQIHPHNTNTHTHTHTSYILERSLEIKSDGRVRGAWEGGGELASASCQQKSTCYRYGGIQSLDLRSEGRPRLPTREQRPKGDVTCLSLLLRAENEEEEEEEEEEGVCKRVRKTQQGT
jgi:hypothetical protein